ncbi:MAG: topoisomerase C-terminal repeat-containing protein, partial [Acidimicrobiales bacterium]
GTVITSPGFLQVYREDDDDEEAGDGRRGRRTESSSASGPAGAPAGSGAPAEDNVRLPRLEEGAGLSCTNILSEEHATKAPARFTEASLIRRLEELGIGRPSTYAGIIQTIQDRGYVWRKGTALVPSFTAFAVVGLMERHFPNLVDYGFTASMEDDLDQIASGSEELVPWLERFYFGETRHLELEQRAGDGHEVDRSGPARGDAGPARGARDQPHHVLAVDGRRGLKDAVLAHLEEIDAREVNSIPIGADPNGEEIVVRVGRYGPYLQRGEERASVPDDVAPDELTVERALVLLESPNGDRALGTDPASGLNVLARAGRFGPYVQLGDAQSGSGKPATASLFGTMSIETVTLSQALQLLTLPRVVGADPESGAEVVAANGRYGPYLKRGEETRSLENEEQLFEVGIEEALRLFAEPKRRRFGASGGPLRELGADPVSGQPVLVRDGRFGPYVTDGSVNASLRRGDDPAEITLERAGELLQARREAGASTPRARAGRGSRVKKASTATKAAPTRKVGAKKAPTKKVGAKKAPTKKTGTRAEAAGTKKVASRAGGAKKAPAKDSSPKSG